MADQSVSIFTLTLIARTKNIDAFAKVAERGTLVGLCIGRRNRLQISKREENKQVRYNHLVTWKAI